MSRPTTLCIDYRDIFLDGPGLIDSVQYPDGSMFDISSNPKDERDDMILVALSHMNDTKTNIKKNNLSSKNAWKHLFKKHNFHHTNLQSHLVAHHTKPENILFVIGNIFDVLHYTHLPSTEKYDLQKNLTQHMSQGFHVIGIGYKEQYHSEITHDDVHGLTWLGAILVQLELKKNIHRIPQQLREQQTSLRILSDDTLETSQAILRQAGIQSRNEMSVRGMDLRSMSDADVRSILPHTLLFAELNDLDKTRLVRLLESLGEIVTDSYGEYAR